ncbi:MAG: hypothetical protein ACOY94_16075 [Bacillota bacterium]
MELIELLRSGAFQQVRERAEEMIRAGGMTLTEEGQVLRLACRASTGMAAYYDAVKLGERAIERATQAGDTPTVAKAHFDLGCSYLYIGDTVAVRRHLGEFLRLLPAVPELKVWEGIAYYNLAHAHAQRKEWQTAIETLNRAATLFDQAGQSRERASCALDTAWYYLQLGAPHLAADHIRQLEVYLEGHHDDHVTANNLVCVRALHARVAGDLAASSRFARELLVPGRPGVDDRHRGEACWILGENALDLGRLEECGAMVDLAAEHAARDNYPTLMNLTSDLRRRYSQRLAAGA